jgi:hypothetical protein
MMIRIRCGLDLVSLVVVVSSSLDHHRATHPLWIRRVAAIIE